ncbi:MAG: hypothetical protein LBK18_00620 [Prevotellaceae bacterium]|jgi:hypothetical protein|nr:hypothetical protein [Prevotellaceae bacterium]
MNKFLKMMASALAIAALASVAVSCSKDDDDWGLTGQWVFMGDANCIFTLNGVEHNAVEEGMLDRSYFSGLRGLSFEFEKGGTVVVGIGGESASWKYSVSGDKLTINDGSGSFPMKYRVSGEKLELIWTDVTMALLGVDDSALTDLGMYDYEFILIFVKAD